MHTPADSHTAYDYFANFESILDWDPSIRSAELVAGEAGQLGARYRLVVGMPLRSIPLEYEIVEAAPPVDGGPARLALRAENADFVSYDVITFDPVPEEGTDVTYDADLALKGLRRPFDPFLALAFQVIGGRARAGLVSALGKLPADRMAG